ncbi:hypothetical protein F6X37_32350 [Paraburkholderia sp. 31.1]|uniref:hypothetical protein n=1 Tax=Paraburkholderia sp. 31.1 TaxID=2615205 RepID=UPI0016555717|nr:hypothetical protein [Paraburkholderia sp. 31.1]MBC8726060.1 hypothetical protein [Paraburkholderia sp. 31.1]
MRAEFAAFKARISSHPVLSGKVHDVIRRTDSGTPIRANYVAVSYGRPDRLEGRYTQIVTAGNDRRYTWDVKVVAVNPDGLAILMEAVLDQMLGHELAVDGRKCTPITVVPDVDDNSGYDRTTDLYYDTVSLRFWSRPA